MIIAGENCRPCARGMCARAPGGCRSALPGVIGPCQRTDKPAAPPREFRGTGTLNFPAGASALEVNAPRERQRPRAWGRYHPRGQKRSGNQCALAVDSPSGSPAWPTRIAAFAGGCAERRPEAARPGKPAFQDQCQGSAAGSSSPRGANCSGENCTEKRGAVNK